MWAAPSKSMSSSQQKGFHIPNRRNSSVYSENREVKFHLWFFFFFLQNVSQKYASYCSFFQKPQAKFEEKENLGIMVKSLCTASTGGTKLPQCLVLDSDIRTPPVCRVCPPPPSCAERLSGCTCGRHSREFKLGQRSKTSIYLSGILGIFLAPL